MTIAPEVREAVRVAYGYCCGYCGVSELDIGGDLQIDHFQPLARGGSDGQKNLVYACVHCNRFKGSYWVKSDLADTLQLLHPAEDDISIHIQSTANGHLEGLTPRGWAHIRRLHLNRSQLIVWRQTRQRVAELEKAVTQAENTTLFLQERIQELEREVGRLRRQIVRLSGEE